MSTRQAGLNRCKRRFSRNKKKNIDKCRKYGIINHVERECWNWQTGTFEGRVFMTYGFKSRLAHQSECSYGHSDFFIWQSIVMNIHTKLKESEPISNRRWVRILCLCRTLRPSPQRRLPPAAVRAFRFRYSVKRRRALKITCGAIIFQPFPFAEH